MKDRERLLAVLDGKPPERIPWIPRLELWYNARKLTGTMPPEWKGLSLRQVEQALGLGTPARQGRSLTYDTRVWRWSFAGRTANESKSTTRS